MPITYNPAVFDARDVAAAMNIILTPEDSTTAERWRNETPYVADLIGQSLIIDSNSVLLDYGCGIGRLAKELIARHGCRVIGVDISAQMRAMAPIYVGSDRFFACPPAMFDQLLERGLTVDGAFAVWVLQHCHKPADDIVRIRRALRADGRLFVLNNLHRAVPTREMSWVDDGIDVRARLCSEFRLLQEGKLPLEHSTPFVVSATYWAAFQRP